jgi:myo-inositol-1(or 4)-monophosphatase
MHPETGSEFLEPAIDAAHRAGAIILDNLGRVSEHDIRVKAASDFVTRVDRESEQVIIDAISQRYPGHQFLAEESAKGNVSDSYCWIIDPLDGTTNYIHGYPVFSVSIALAFAKEVILGVVFDPLRDELFAAEKGMGMLLNGKRAVISPVTNVKDSLVATGFPFRNKGIISQYLKAFTNIFAHVSDIRRAGSAALDLAYIACGRCEGFFETGLSPWDIAAGALMIEESGGVVTDFDGGRDYLINGSIVAGVPEIQSFLLREVQKVFSVKI